MKSYFFCIILLVFSSACTGSESDNKESKQDHDVTELIDEEAIKRYLDEIDPKTRVSREIDSLTLITCLKSASAEGANKQKATNIETPLYSSEMNKQIYTKILAIFPQPEVESIKESYKKNIEIVGSFLATADIQRVIDIEIVNRLTDNIVDRCVTGKTGLDETYKSKIKQIQDTETAVFAAIHYPSAQTMSNKLDEVFYSLEFVNDRQKKRYNKSVKDFQKKQVDKSKGNVENYLNLIAYKAYLIDKTILEKEINELNILCKIFGERIDTKFVLSEFEKAAMPKP